MSPLTEMQLPLGEKHGSGLTAECNTKELFRQGLLEGSQLQSEPQGEAERLFLNINLG